MILRKEVRITASPGEVWKAWTTAEGVRTFFAVDAAIALEIGGRYEMYFMLSAPEGTRGSEGCVVLSFQPQESLVVSWNFPPTLPEIRDERTRVRIDLEPINGDTWVRIVQDNWGEGPQYEAGYAYFQRAWDLVLGRLRHRFAQGPVDWDEPYDPVARGECYDPVDRLN